MKIISPNSRDKYIEKLLDRIKAEHDPEIISKIPIEKGLVDDCFGNVDLKITSSGGKRHYGWVVWKSRILYEAEFHCVWESETGELIDVSPSDLNLDRIMFISDNEIEYSGQLIDNIRLNCTKNSVVDDFIIVCETIEKLYANHSKRIDNSIVELPKEVQKEISRLELIKDSIGGFAIGRGRKTTMCFCGNGEKYKNCHGKNIVEKMKSIATKYR